MSITQDEMKKYTLVELLVADMRKQNKSAEIKEAALHAFRQYYNAYQAVIIDIYNKIHQDYSLSNDISIELQNANLNIPIKGFQEMWNTFGMRGYTIEDLADLDIELQEARYNAEDKKFYTIAVDWKYEDDPAYHYLTLTPNEVLNSQNKELVEQEKEKFRQLIMPIAQPYIESYNKSKNAEAQELEDKERAEYERLKRKFETEYCSGAER